MSRYKLGERVWVKHPAANAQRQWIRSTVLGIESVAGPLGVPTFCYTLGIGTYYEMTLKNFDWMHRRTPAASTTPTLAAATRGGSAHST